ncbi:MAG: hypothetical protein ACT4R6_08445 [Gemmatimonadaceae bacterium]
MVRAESGSSPPDRRTLGDVVAALAGRASDGLLAACAVAGVAGAAGVGLLLRPLWWLLPLMLGLAAFGSWGIADRERAALGWRGAVFRAVRVVSALTGAAAAAFVAVLLFIALVGPLKS